MEKFRKLSVSERNSETPTAPQARAEQNRAMPDRCELKPGAPDVAPPLVARIATSFWCQPAVRGWDNQQQPKRHGRFDKRRTTMPAKAEQCITLLALALAVAAAILSAPDLANKMHHISQWLTASTAPEAAAIAGAIGENPVGLQGP